MGAFPPISLVHHNLHTQSASCRLESAYGFDGKRPFDRMQTVFEALNNAYILFSFILGIWAAVLAGRNLPLSGEFWGSVVTNTLLAVVIFIVALILTLQGKRPRGLNPDNPDDTIIRGVYYLYAVYFIISLPGVYTLSGGNTNRRTALIYGGVALFNSAAAYRAIYWLLTGWE